jgi:hypothetical protein
MTANKELQKQAFDLYSQTIALIRGQRKLFLELGYVLSIIKEKGLYREMGDGGFDTWRSFLANPEINITPSTADVYIKVYSFYVEKLGMPKDEILLIPLVRLNMMKSKLEGMTELERGELIEKAKTLSYTDFKIEAIDGGVERLKAIKITKCDTCNKLIIKYDPEQVCDCTGAVDVTPYDN